MKCLNINNPQIQSELNKLTSILGDANAAYAVLALNNGYGLDKAPNGQESKLFQDIREALLSENSSLSQEELIKQTYLKKVLCYTPSFLDWFGDWVDNPDNASKVVDENGEPLMVYHGSPEVFNEFDLAFLEELIQEIMEEDTILLMIKKLLCNMVLI